MGRNTQVNWDVRQHGASGCLKPIMVMIFVAAMAITTGCGVMRSVELTFADQDVMLRGVERFEGQVEYFDKDPGSSLRTGSLVRRQ